MFQLYERHLHLTFPQQNKMYLQLQTGRGGEGKDGPHSDRPEGGGGRRQELGEVRRFVASLGIRKIYHCISISIICILDWCFSGDQQKILNLHINYSIIFINMYRIAAFLVTRKK